MLKHKVTSKIASFLVCLFCIFSISDTVYGAYNDNKPVPEDLTGNYVQDLLAIALSQLGYEESSTGETIFSAWAGQDARAWCSEFASWCADQAGIPKNIIPKCTSAPEFRMFYFGQGRYFIADNGQHDNCQCSKFSSGYISISDIEPGDIILTKSTTSYFDDPNHTCICVSVSGDKVTTIDGNSSGKVALKTRTLNTIHGVCKPKYNDIPQIITAPTSLTKAVGDARFLIGATNSGTGELYYTSSDNSVAYVNDMSGLVTITGTGTTIITISAAPTNRYLAAKVSFPLTVTKGTPVITASNVTVCSGDEAFYLNAACDTNSLTYSSTNKKLATVNKSGLVTLKNRAVGTVTIKVKAQANEQYNALTQPVTITILPKSTTLSTVSSKSAKKINVTWKKDTSIRGYQIQYSTDKNFMKNVKTKIISKNTTSKYTLKNLASKKTYYVRVRTYYKVNNVSYRSEWSPYRSVRCK